MKKFFCILAVIALAIATYTQRSRILDLVIEWQKPNVEAVAFEDIGGATTPREEGVEESKDVEEVEEISESPTLRQDVAEQPVVETDSETPRLYDSTTPSLPTEYNLAVPFTSQAPYGVWDAVHEQTCEEASVLMVAAYYDKQPAGAIDIDTADEELQRIIKFEDAFFGYNEDTTAEETALVLESYNYLSTELISNPTIEQIKEAIAAGYPVIVPAAGRQLGNPYFTPPGPLYHMLVVKGYTEDTFITNDPGTRHGQNYSYDQDVLMNAIHDWNGGEVELGEKVVIIVKP